MDIARLGLAVDSSQVEKGTVELRQLTGAAGQASAAARQLAGASQVEAAGQKAATAATHAHNAALTAQNAIIRSSMQQRTMMIYQLNDVAVSLASGMNPAMVFMQQGSQILQGGLVPALRTIGDLAKGLVMRFWPLAAAAGAVVAVLQAMTDEINAVNGSNVTMMDTALAVFQSMADGIKTLLRPAFDWLAGVWGEIGPRILGAVETTVNGIIGGFEVAYKDVITIWTLLPAALGDVVYQAAQSTVNGVIYMVREVQVAINGFITDVNGQLAKMGAQWSIPTMDLMGYADVQNPYAGGAAAYESGLAQNRADVAGKNYFGDWMNDIGLRAQQIALARKETEDLGGTADAANEKVKKLANDGLELVKGALSGIGSGLWGAIREGGNVLGNILDMLMSKVDNLIGKLLDSSIDRLLFGPGDAGGGLLSDLAGPLGMLFGGARANGGPVEPGRAYLVNENTPRSELFVPRTAGTIVPAGRAGTGGNVIYLTMANTFSTTGSITERDLQEQNRIAAAEMGRQVVEVVKKSLPGWQTNIQVHGAA